MPATIGKDDQIRELAALRNTSFAEASRWFDSMLGLWRGHALRGDTIRIPEIMSMEPERRKARKGRNPRTGESMKIPAKTVLSTSISRKLNESLNLSRTERLKEAKSLIPSVKKPPARVSRAEAAEKMGQLAAEMQHVQQQVEKKPRTRKAKAEAQAAAPAKTTRSRTRKTAEAKTTRRGRKTTQAQATA